MRAPSFYLRRRRRAAHKFWYCRQFGLGEKFALLTSWPHLLAYVRRVAAACPRLVDELQMPLINKIYWQSGTYSPLCGNDPTSPVPATIELFDA